ncbi:MAG: T9SS type A sorting domain-containing protein [Saprospiraceae bacterium]|nr:MAG: T9SS type A sorting domain-containing protein [Saprospiraceae bacterium]
MKRILPLITMGVLAAQLCYAQLPPGSTAPNWTMTDLNGTSHTLYDYLNNEKVVFLDFSATWCGPCWNYHNTHAFKDLYNEYGPSGTDNVMCFFIETDASTNTNCLYGPAGCVGGTQGNWVSGTPYPIIDDASQSGPYAINYYPTIYGVCPSKEITEVGQVPKPQLWSFAQGCSAPNLNVTALTNVNCYGQTTGAISIGLTGGISPFTFQWNNGATTQNLTNIPAGSYSVTVTGSLGGTKTLGPILVTQPATPLNVTVSGVTPAGCGFGGTASVDASGGTPGYSYLWSNGATTASIFNVPPGTYSATATDENGCTDFAGNIVIAPPAVPTAAAAVPNQIDCNNTSITLDGTGSTTGSTIVYVWSTSNGHIVSGATTLNDCVVDQAGTYNLLVYNSESGCTATASVTATANTALPASSAGAGGTITCTITQLTLNGSGSSGTNIEYLWTTVGGNIVSGATTLHPLVNAAGEYTLTVSNTGNGCTASDDATVTASTEAPNVSATGGELTCSNSTVQLAGNSTTNGVDFAWSGPGGFSSTEQNPTVSTAGTYTLTVTDGNNGCTAGADAAVIENTTTPQASAEGGTIDCSNATVTLAGSSSTPGVTYEWAGPNSFSSTEQNPEVENDGNYTLTVTAPNGCTEIATAIVNENIAPPTADAGANGLLNCNASSVVLNGTGSSGGNQYSYLWTTTNGNIASGETTLTPTVDAAGSYTLTVTNNNNGCTSTAATTVTQSPAVTAIVASQTNTACFGEATGSATIEGGGGNGSFTYEWSTGETSATASGLSAGTYTVTVTDSEGCTASETATITQPGELTVTTGSTAQTAPGVNDGTATASANGGTGNYTYEWSNGATTATITGLAPGVFFVLVTDENGCAKSETITVNVFGCAVNANAVGVAVSCNGAGDGSASISLSNAALPASFEWSNGQTGDEITNLSPGTYIVTATDGNGCEVVASVNIVQPLALNANGTSTGETAAGAGDGTATAAPTGGTGPYSFEWSNGETTATITGLVSANYIVSVTDANGCAQAQTIPVAPFECALGANVSVINISCNGTNDGQATVTLTGGLSPFYYEWSNEGTTATISNLAPGVYTATVADAVNCAAIAEITISEPNALEAAVTASANASCDSNNGMATVTALGGTPEYTFAWPDGNTGPTAINLAPGTYSVSVSDAHDCETTVEVVISVDDEEAPAIVTQNLTLALDENGLAELTPSQVDNGSTDNCTIESMALDITNFDCNSTGAQEVTLTVTDEAGNSSTGTAIITVVDNKPPFVHVQNITVSLDENGEAVISANMLDNGSSDNCGIAAMTVDISNFGCNDLGSNAVVLTVTDASGNSSSGTSIVTVEDKLAPVVECPGNMVLPYCNPVAEYSVTGEDNCAGSLTYTLASGLPGGSEFPTGETVVEVEVTDQSGNTNICSFTVTVPEAMILETATADVSCFGEGDGSASVAATGGTPGYTYLWSNGEIGASIEGLVAGEYSVAVTDAAGCEETQSMTITEPAELETTVNELTNETGNEGNGAINVTVSGGAEPYQYLWTDDNGNSISTEEDVSGLVAGTYTLEVTDGNGCISLNVYTIQSVTGTNEPELENSISLFPNPASGQALLQLVGIQLNSLDIQVYDVRGRIVASYLNANVAAGSYLLDLSAQSGGVYLVRILVENQVVTKRIIINR